MQNPHREWVREETTATRTRGTAIPNGPIVRGTRVDDNINPFCRIVLVCVVEYGNFELSLDG